MRQRVIIAMALALEPELVIMDEPTTALDVVVQREILQELQQLQRELGFAVLFITHDLSLLLEFADRVAIMYAGEIVELAESPELFTNALHPYSVGLLELVPAAHGADRAARGHPGHPARPRRPARRVPLPSPLPALPARRRRAVHAPDHRAAGAQARRSRPRGRLPPRRGDALVSTTELEVRGLTKDFKTEAARRRRRELHAPARARSPRSSARAAAARAPSRASSRGCTTRPRAR